MKDLLRGMFDAAIAAAQPSLVMPMHLPAPPRGRTVVIGAGKAAAAMAGVLEALWPAPLEGMVVTRYGYGGRTRRIEVVEAAHPVPDAAGLAAATRMLELVRGLTSDDLVLCLLSGGASALLPLPLAPLTLADKQALTGELLRCGATISEINCVRRHLSAIKGGRLAAACHPARVLTLAISDVPADDPADIGSGPTAPDATTCADAMAVLQRYPIEVPKAVRELLESGRGESVKPGDPRLARSELRLIATPAMALEAAASVARREGVTPILLGDAIEGEAREVAKVFAGMALHAAGGAEPFRLPCVLLSGGETTVTVRGSGRGGRNVEFVLALAIALRGHPAVHALAGDTDGVDGIEEIAGAYAWPGTLERARSRGIDARQALADNDAHSFFEALGDSIVTGPTRTNVNDFRAVLVTAPPGERDAPRT